MRKCDLIYLLVLLFFTISSHVQVLLDAYSIEEKKEVFFPVKGLLIGVKESNSSEYISDNYVTAEYVRDMTEDDGYYIKLEKKIAEKLLRDLNFSKNDLVF